MKNLSSINKKYWINFTYLPQNICFCCVVNEPNDDIIWSERATNSWAALLTLISRVNRLWTWSMAKLLRRSWDMRVRRNVLRRLKPVKLLSAVAEVTGSNRNSFNNFATSLNTATCGHNLRRHEITVVIVARLAVSGGSCEALASCRHPSWRMSADWSMSFPKWSHILYHTVTTSNCIKWV